MTLAIRDDAWLMRPFAVRPKGYYGRFLVGALLLAVGNAGAEQMALANLTRAPTALPTAILDLTFRETCWTEIHDGTGKRLFYDLGKAGQHIRYETVPPVRLLLGNAQGVDVVYGGNPVDTSATVPGKVRRMVLPPGAEPEHPDGNAPVAAEEPEDGNMQPGRLANADVAERLVALTGRVADSGAAEVALLQTLPDPGTAEAVAVQVPTTAPGETSMAAGTTPNRIEGQNDPSGRDITMALETVRHPDTWFEAAATQTSTAPEVQSTAVATPAASTRTDSAEPKDSGEAEQVALLNRTMDPDRWFGDVPAEVEAPEEAAVEEEVPSKYPRLLATSDFTVEYDSQLEAEDPEDEFDDWLANIDTALLYHWTPRTSLRSRLRVVLDGEDDGLHRFNTDFPDEGLYLRELKLQHDRDRFSVFGGKYEPGARLYGYAPVYFGNYVSDLNLEERIGLGTSLFFSKQEKSEIKLSAHAFFMDTSSLSGELIGAGARNGIIDNQVGDTGTLDNYLVTFNGGATGWDPGFRYTVGIAEQQGNDRDILDESASLAAVFHMIRLDSGADLEFSVDYLAMENPGGWDEETESITVGAGLSQWPFLIGASYSERTIDPGDRTDRISEVVFRKGIVDSVWVELAYQRTHEADQDESSFGASVTYSHDWGDR